MTATRQWTIPIYRKMYTQTSNNGETILCFVRIHKIKVWNL